MQLTANFVED